MCHYFNGVKLRQHSGDVLTFSLSQAESLDPTLCHMQTEVFFDLTLSASSMNTTHPQLVKLSAKTVSGPHAKVT